MRRVVNYQTDNSNYPYSVEELKNHDNAVEFVMVVPPPRDMIRRSCKKWPNSFLVSECIDDFGLTETDRHYNDDGTVTVFGN